jgi:uncharacterized protein (TIGR00269 family)
MRCRKCGKEAVMNMRQHKLALCRDHYIEWFIERTEKTIRLYKMFRREDKILVAVSGGKDSLSLWDVLLRLGYKADGMYINLGIEHQGYSQVSLEKVKQFASAHPEAKLHIVDIKALYGRSIPEFARESWRGQRVCALCGLVKRHEMNRLAIEGGYYAIATGHNLDDEAAALLGNVLRWQTGYLARQGPVLPSDYPGLARKVKPFCRMYERETAAYALLMGIDYIYDECPYAVGSTSIFYKNLLNQLERNSPGSKLSFYLSFLQAKEEGRVRFKEEEAPPLHACQRCGQPTTAPGYCAFCRLVYKPSKEEVEAALEGSTDVDFA